MLLEYLSKKLLLEKSYIEELANTASIRYKQYYIPKKNGALRSILHPAKELKTLQRTIHEDILNFLPVHKAAYAYRKGIGLRDHASVHSSSRYILRMDFKNFFESISDKNIEDFFNENGVLISSDWNMDDTILLRNLICYKNSLTIGSVTSPSISNIICNDLDLIIDRYCLSKGIKYTRYADDLYFSTDKPNILREVEKHIYSIVKNLKRPDELKINKSKTHHASKKNKMSVTGIILTNDGQVSIGRDQKRKIRSMIHQWDSLDGKHRKYLVGYLSFCVSIEPEFINSLCRKYGADVISTIQTYLHKNITTK